MYLVGLSLQWICIALAGWILALLWRRNLGGSFPVFTVYIGYVIVQMMLRSAFLSDAHVYLYVFWITAPIEMILTVLAVQESFLRVFRSFYLLRWFRIILPGTITATLVTSGWKAYLHPAHGSRAAAAIIGTAVTAQYIVLAISILFFMLVGLLRVPWRIHEYRIVLGFGLSALALSFAGSVRSEFGTEFEVLSRMLPGVAYLLTLVIWLTAVKHPPPKEPELPDVELLPERLVEEARRHLMVIRSLWHRE